jgi:hypothetical protein
VRGGCDSHASSLVLDLGRKALYRLSDRAGRLLAQRSMLPQPRTVLARGGSIPGEATVHVSPWNDVASSRLHITAQRIPAMNKRLRKLIGAVVLVAFICVYALVAMAIAEGRVRDAGTFVQTIVYILLGLIWILPVMPLIRWMEKPDKA